MFVASGQRCARVWLLIAGGTALVAGCGGSAGTTGDASDGMTSVGGAAGAGGMTGTSGAGGMAGASGSGGSGDSGAQMCRDEPTHMGGLTQYDQTPLGNCGMPWPDDDLYGAMATADYDDSAVCGMCAEVTGPTGMKAIIHVVDQCPVGSNPKCTAGHIDLSHTAYRAVVPANHPTGGEVPNSQPVPWKYVPCDVSGPIVYHFKDGTHMNWLAVQIRNSRYGIANVRWRRAGSGGAFQPMAARSNDLAYFVVDGPSTTSYDFQVTDVNGQVLQDDGVQLIANGDRQGHAQFPVCTQ